MTVFQYGDKVRKIQGYPWDGTVQSVFNNRKGQTRVVVELSRGFDGDALHIFNPDQLAHCEPPTRASFPPRNSCECERSV